MDLENKEPRENFDYGFIIKKLSHKHAYSFEKKEEITRLIVKILAEINEDGSVTLIDVSNH